MQKLAPTFKWKVQKLAKEGGSFFFCSCNKKVTTGFSMACAMALQELCSDTMLNFNA
jgi:hypothetical protein